MHVKFKKNGITKEVKVGFSWTVIFFGWMALAIRGQALPAILGFFTFNITSLYFMFTANRLLARKMVENGWVAIEPMPKSWGIDQ